MKATAFRRLHGCTSSFLVLCSVLQHHLLGDSIMADLDVSHVGREETQHISIITDQIFTTKATDLALIY